MAPRLGHAGAMAGAAPSPTILLGWDDILALSRCGNMEGSLLTRVARESTGILNQRQEKLALTVLEASTPLNCPIPNHPKTSPDPNHGPRSEHADPPGCKMTPPILPLASRMRPRWCGKPVTGHLRPPLASPWPLGEQPPSAPQSPAELPAVSSHPANPQRH